MVQSAIKVKSLDVISWVAVEARMINSVPLTHQLTTNNALGAVIKFLVVPALLEALFPD